MHTSTLLTYLLAAAPAALAATPVDDSQCDCYVTNGTRPYYYKQHIWFDFRNLGQYAGTPNPISDWDGLKNAPFTSGYFDWSQKWGQYWGLQNWDSSDGAYPRINSKSNVYIEKNTDASKNSDTFLSMRTARYQNFQSCSEFESINKYQYASMRMYSRTKGYDGACTSMFTYKAPPADDASKVQEVDIEFLTQERRNVIHYTNQPSRKNDQPVPGSTVAVNTPNGRDWTGWTYHRLDWTPDKTVFSVDGKEAAALTVQVPKDPATLIFNAWSNGDPTWSGPMAVGGEAWQQIQWIEILANPADKNSCPRVCSIDNTPEIGKPVRV